MASKHEKLRFPPAQGKPHFFPTVCFFLVSLLYGSHKTIPDPSGHQMHGDFPPHQVILCDISWVSYNPRQL